MMYMVSFIVKKYKNISLYLVIGYFSRLLLMLWDLYARNVFLIPSSGSDSEGFYKTAVLVSSNLELLKENVYGGFYTKTLGFIFRFLGENRIFGQYINVLLGVGIIILVYKSLRMLNIGRKNINLAVIVISLFPHALIFSAILLRENFIAYFVTLSAYYFIKWYKQGKGRNQFYSTLFILIASSFHSGVIGVLSGYIFMYIFYDREKKELKITLKSLLLIIAFILLGIVILNNSDTFLGKFAGVEKADDIVSTANARDGGSQYLQSLQTDSLLMLLIYSPIYMLYFLISPLPWNFRGLNDLAVFFIDSIFYLWSIYIIFKTFINRAKIKKSKYIILGLSVSMLITVFIFGIGVANTGTAMRHRHKIFPLFVILITIMRDEYYDKN